MVKNQTKTKEPTKKKEVVLQKNGGNLPGIDKNAYELTDEELDEVAGGEDLQRVKVRFPWLPNVQLS